MSLLFVSFAIIFLARLGAWISTRRITVENKVEGFESSSLVERVHTWYHPARRWLPHGTLAESMMVKCEFETGRCYDCPMLASPAGTVYPDQ